MAISTTIFLLRRLKALPAWHVCGWLLLCLSAQTQAQSVVIASGEHGGLYHRFAEKLTEKIKRETGSQVTVVNTQGTAENLALLRKGEADMAIVQSGVGPMDDIDVVTPLFFEPVLVLARPGLDIHSMADLSGKTLNIGAKGSGTRITAERLLGHYEIGDYRLDEGRFYSADTQPGYDVAIVVGGLLNQRVRAIIRKYRLKMIAVEDGRAIATRYAHLSPYKVPRGIFSGRPAMPGSDTATVASTALLVSRKGIDEAVIGQALKAIYETDLSTAFPVLLTPEQVKAWHLFPLKPKSQSYLNPYSGIAAIAHFAEFLAAIKEIIFAVIAAAYFAWLGWRRLEAKKAEAVYNEFKEKLDVFVDESVRLERKTVTNDPAELAILLSEATELKLKALTELTHEQLRGDNLFAIFLAQCSNLIMRIEQKLYRHTR